MLQQNNGKPTSSNLLKWLGGAGVFLLLKGKALLSVLKFSKFAGPVISMMVSVGAYALIYPWSFAIGFVLLLLVHELGHVIAAKQKGLPVSAPLFIPFVGALISMKKRPLDAQTEAYIAFGGPLLGTVGATAVFWVALYLDHPLLYSLAYVGFFLNLINLLPIHPLDGGRISTAVSRWLWLVGLVGGLVVIFYMRSFLFFIIWALFAYDLFNKYIRRRKNHKNHFIMKSFVIALTQLQSEGYLIPGPEHKRNLPFATYSDLNRQQHVTIFWESLGLRGIAQLPQQSIIHKVSVAGVDQVYLEDGPHLKVNCEINFTVYDNDKYYDVPTNVRWKYGISYFCLAGLLGIMMYMVQSNHL
ncbi:site-2 protease family protein [Paenibacillus anaericanus]|uniref:Site-2 protease family protein n=1 Tax=Paenibacillus anaericanus TaxID=170367 RepID=A0A433Y729_9BACL|nr:site-2 protease family protein [Paenibacillus anaericanus]RUT45266.1 site-2 protease family protein [Paenibacillus anaericanus]